MQNDTLIPTENFSLNKNVSPEINTEKSSKRVSIRLPPIVQPAQTWPNNLWKLGIFSTVHDETIWSLFLFFSLYRYSLLTVESLLWFKNVS